MSEIHNNHSGDLKQKSAHSIVLVTFAMFLATSLFCASLMSYKLVKVGPFAMSAATLVVPIWYLCGDMITELFGYRLTKKLIWISMFISMFFALFIQFLIHLPSPPGWPYQSDFNYVLGHMLKINLASFIGVLCGGFINSFALSKWKILIRGKYYWLRSIGSSTIGQAVYISITLPIIFYGMVSTKDMFEIMIASLIGKTIILLISIGPIAWVIRFIKVTQKLDHYDVGISYNPFSLNS